MKFAFISFVLLWLVRVLSKIPSTRLSFFDVKPCDRDSCVVIDNCHQV